jgi:hypothetical protein
MSIHEFFAKPVVNIVLLIAFTVGLALTVWYGYFTPMRAAFIGLVIYATAVADFVRRRKRVTN